MFSNLILSFSTPKHKPPYIFHAINTNTRERESQVRLYTQPTRFELEYYYMIALVFLDSKLQVEEKIIDR
jgi:hypothetical protein